jgi:signal transduction histidine kinase
MFIDRGFIAADVQMRQILSLRSVKKIIDLYTKLLFGDPEKLSLENRAFNATLFLVFCAGVTSVGIDFYVHGSRYMYCVSLCAVFLSLAAYFLSRYLGIWKQIVLPGYILFLCLLSVGWIVQGGMNGRIMYFFFLLTCSAIIVFDGLWKFFALIIVLLFVTFLILIEFFHPEIIVPYANLPQRYMNNALAFVLCLMINGSMTYIVFREFQRERKAKNILVESIIREKENVEKAVTTKQRLLSMVCHDILNGLAVVLANTSASIKMVRQSQIKDGDPENRKDAMKYLDNIKFGAMKINEIIDSVRLMQAIEDGTESIQLSQVSVEYILENVKRLFSDRLREKNINLEVSLPPGPDSFMVRTEPKMLCNHILGNLISNAIKYSYPGSTITIAGWKIDGKIYLSIADQGIGIPQDIKEHLFSPGFKVGRKGTGGEPGTGLGLLVVKSFIKLLNAAIELESKPEDSFPNNHGTTVNITFNAD